MIQQFLLLIKKQNGPSHDYQSHTNTLHAYIIIHPMLHSYSLVYSHAAFTVHTSLRYLMLYA